jgi:hypothetical protein
VEKRARAAWTSIGTLAHVTEAREESQRFEAVCPHCRKPFVAELLARPSARHRGFKCPHCKLFVPRERVIGDLGSPATSH